MPMKPMRPCAKPGCGELCRGRYCDNHKPVDAYVRGESEQYHNFYMTPAWKNGRAQFLAEHPWCSECSKLGLRTKAEVVDHIRPHRGSIALFLDRSNWQGLCKKHHDQKTMRERSERGRLA